MEKNTTKCKKSNIHVPYPAPYSQSWNPDVLPVLMKTSVVGNTSLYRRSRKPVDSSRTWSQQFPADRPDPTAPHLKYGVFRNRRKPEPRPSIEADKMAKGTQLPARQTKLKRKQQDNQIIEVPQDYNRKRYPIPKAKLKNVDSTYPVYIINTMEKKTSRQLVVSKIMHIDIKPKRISSLSPSFCPSPNFKTLSRRLTASSKMRFDGVE